MRLIVLPGAKIDIEEAFDWYDRQAPGLGERVLHVIEQRFETIVQTPQGFPKIRGEFRQALVQTFPYIVIYRLVGSTIEVHAVFQANRDPAIWRKRIADQ